MAKRSSKARVNGRFAKNFYGSLSEPSSPDRIALGDSVDGEVLAIERGSVIQ